MSPLFAAVCCVRGVGGSWGKFTLGGRGQRPLVSLGLAHVLSLRWIEFDESVSLLFAPDCCVRGGGGGG